MITVFATEASPKAQSSFKTTLSNVISLKKNFPQAKMVPVQDWDVSKGKDETRLYFGSVCCARCVQQYKLWFQCATS